MKKPDTFERSEKKFLLDKRQLPGLMAALEGAMQVDQYGRHTICSLYFDTEDFRSGTAQLAKPVYKEKLRLRSYGVPRAEDTVFLELKKKLCGITYKRRMPLSLAEAKAYLQNGTPPFQTGQVFGEIDWFMQQYHPTGKALICYDRVAMQGVEDPDLRLTLDENVRWRSHSLDLAQGDWGSPLTRPGQVLMEIKTHGAIPVWLCRILSQASIYSASFSKYGNAYQGILQQEVARIAG